MTGVLLVSLYATSASEEKPQVGWQLHSTQTESPDAKEERKPRMIWTIYFTRIWGYNSLLNCITTFATAWPDKGGIIMITWLYFRPSLGTMTLHPTPDCNHGRVQNQWTLIGTNVSCGWTCQLTVFASRWQIPPLLLLAWSILHIQ